MNIYHHAVEEKIVGIIRLMIPSEFVAGVCSRLCVHETICRVYHVPFIVFTTDDFRA